MKLIEYLPEFLQKIREYKVLFDVEDIELDELKERLEDILDEVIVNTADSYGIERYEKIYSIKPDSNDIEKRRFNILSKINNRVPYTINWLKSKLDNIVGKDNYVITIDHNNYKIKIEILAIFKEVAELLNKDLREQLSANMEITVNLFQTEQCQMYFAGFVHTGDYIEIRQVV